MRTPVQLELFAEIQRLPLQEGQTLSCADVDAAAKKKRDYSYNIVLSDPCPSCKGMLTVGDYMFLGVCIPCFNQGIKDYYTEI